MAGPSDSSPTRRAFLHASAAAAVAGGCAAGQQRDLEDEKPLIAERPAPDAYKLAARSSKFLRVTDVTDGLDALGRADQCLLDSQIRPLWMGMRFWGPALTMRVIPTHRNMPIISRQDALRQHAIWKEMGGWHADLKDHLKPGCVIVTSTNGARECGYWGSNNSLDMQSQGVAGIVT